jgi:hypothetical protein
VRVNQDGKEFKVVFKHDCTLGGRRFTKCLIECDGGPTFEGVAFCSSKDHFSKERGRKVSLARALKEAFLSTDSAKSIRTAFWNAYLGRKGS